MEAGAEWCEEAEVEEAPVERTGGAGRGPGMMKVPDLRDPNILDTTRTDEVRHLLPG